MDKSKLSLEQQIEYYLGKDRLPNLHWTAQIPPTWTIPPRSVSMMLCNPESYNTTVVLEDISYTLNNLGYRANFDFVLDTLKEKNIVLILGDSDTFGRGLTLETTYPTKMQHNTEYCILNLGIPGLSPDGMARVGVQSVLALGSAVKHVCVLWPVFSLREFVSKTFNSGVHTISSHTPYADWWDHIDWVSNNYNYQKNKILIQQTTENIGAQYHDLIINRNDKSAPTTYITVDQQFTELDSSSHTAIAQYFLRKIHNQPSLFQILQS